MGAAFIAIGIFFSSLTENQIVVGHPDLRRPAPVLDHQLGLVFGLGRLEGRPQLPLLLPALRQHDPGHPGHDRPRLLPELRLLRALPDPLGHPVPAVEISHGQDQEEPQHHRPRAARPRRSSPSASGRRSRSSPSSSPSSGVAAIVVYIALNLGQLKTGLKPASPSSTPSNLLLVVVLVLGIVVLLNIFFSRHHHRFDFTEAKLHSPLRPVDQGRSRPSRTTSRSRASSARATPAAAGWRTCSRSTPTIRPKIKYEFIDPDKNPGLVKRYEVTQDGTTILECGRQGHPDHGRRPRRT